MTCIAGVGLDSSLALKPNAAPGDGGLSAGPRFGGSAGVREGISPATQRGPRATLLASAFSKNPDVSSTYQQSLTKWLYFDFPAYPDVLWMVAALYTQP